MTLSNCHPLSLKQNFLFIMNNRPFFSTTNVYDQNMFSTVPTNFNGQNVLVSHEQQRKIFDTLNTSIVGIPFENSPTNNHFIQAQKQFVPGGVVFSFNPQPLPQPQSFMMQQMPYPNPNNMNGYYPSSLEQQIAANGLQKHGLESLNYQQQLASNPFQLKFHLDISTSCSDLMDGSSQVPASSSSRIVRNIIDADSLQNQERRNGSFERPIPNSSWLSSSDFTLPTFASFRTIKRLNLHQQPVQQKSRVIDALEVNDDNDISKTKKTVYFADEHQKDKEDKWTQISYRCKCNGNNGEVDKKKKRKPKNSKNTRKKEEKEESSEFSSDSSKSSNDSSEYDQMACYLNDINNGQKSKDMNDSQYWSSDECKLKKRTNHEHNWQ